MSRRIFQPGSFKFRSPDSGRTYTMTITNRGQGQHIECSCPGFRRWFQCKHVHTAKNFGELPESASPTQETASQHAKHVMKEQYEMNAATTATRKVRIVKKSTPPKYRVGRQVLPLDKPVNVKVAGQRTMLKSVTLVPNDSETVKVRTGRRGRPMILPVSNIERVRAL